MAGSAREYQTSAFHEEKTHFHIWSLQSTGRIGVCSLLRRRSSGDIQLHRDGMAVSRLPGRFQLPGWAEGQGSLGTLYASSWRRSGRLGPHGSRMEQPLDLSYWPFRPCVGPPGSRSRCSSRAQHPSWSASEQPQPKRYGAHT